MFTVLIASSCRMTTRCPFRVDWIDEFQLTAWALLWGKSTVCAFSGGGRKKIAAESTSQYRTPVRKKALQQNCGLDNRYYSHEQPFPFVLASAIDKE